MNDDRCDGRYTGRAIRHRYPHLKLNDTLPQLQLQLLRFPTFFCGSVLLDGALRRFTMLLRFLLLSVSREQKREGPCRDAHAVAAICVC